MQSPRGHCATRGACASDVDGLDTCTSSWASCVHRMCIARKLKRETTCFSCLQTEDSEDGAEKQRSTMALQDGPAATVAYLLEAGVPEEDPPSLEAVDKFRLYLNLKGRVEQNTVSVNHQEVFLEDLIDDQSEPISAPFLNFPFLCRTSSGPLIYGINLISMIPFFRLSCVQRVSLQCAD